MSPMSLLRRGGPVILFTVAMTFASSLGQTFFVSLFLPSLTRDLALEATAVAGMYGAATLAAGLTLSWLGGLADRYDLVRLGLAAGLAAMAGALLVAAAAGPIVLLLGFVLLRLCGQGMIPHIAYTGTARYIRRGRGRAVALGSLGHAIGEGVLPLLMVGFIASHGWRPTYAGTGLIVGLVLVPLASFAVRRRRNFRRPPGREAIRPRLPSVLAMGLLRRPGFWPVLLGIAAAPVISTALLFHQGFIGETRDLPMSVFAAGFVGFAIVQAPAAYLAGVLIDRLGSRLVLALHLIPLAAGVAIFASVAEAWGVWAYLTLAGVTTAFNSPLRTTAVAEIVGPAEIGRARSVSGAMILAATSVAPFALGAPLQLGADPEATLWCVLFLTIAAGVVTFLLGRAEETSRRPAAS